MARIPEISSKEDLPDDKQHIFDAIANSRGQVSGPFPLLLNSPEVAGRVAHLGAYIRFESVLPPAIRELAIITVARECDCEYEWWAHSKLAREEGIREKAIEAVAHRASTPLLTDEEATVVCYSRELVRNHRVSEATFEAARTRYGHQGVVDLTATVGYYSMLAWALNAFEVEPPGPKRLP